MDAATDMLSNHLDFREQQGLNNTTQGSNFALGPTELNLPQTKLIREFYPHAYHGLAKDGSAVYIERLGLLNPAVFDKVSTADFLDYFMYESEVLVQKILPAASLAQGRLVEKVAVILDLKGVSAWSAYKAMKTIKAVCKMQQANCPENMKIMIIINAPPIASWVYSVIKVLLDPTTQAKIQIISHTETARRDACLGELMEVEDMPAFLGGQCQCSGGCMVSCKGPWSDPKIKRILEAVPYWEILTRIVAGEHSKLMTEYQDCVGNEIARDGHSRHVPWLPTTSLEKTPVSPEETTPTTTQNSFELSVESQSPMSETVHVHGGQSETQDGTILCELIYAKYGMDPTGSPDSDSDLHWEYYGRSTSQIEFLQAADATEENSNDAMWESSTSHIELLRAADTTEENSNEAMPEELEGEPVDTEEDVAMENRRDATVPPVGLWTSLLPQMNESYRAVAGWFATRDILNDEPPIETSWKDYYIEFTDGW